MKKNDLKKLRKKLPKDWVKRVHEKTGYKASHIYMVINKKRENQTIVDAAIEIAKEFQISQDAKRNLINNL